MSDQEQFAQMMMALQSPDNALRKHAEETYQQTKTSNGNWLFQALLELSAESDNTALQKICLVELRKILLHPEFTLSAFTNDDVERIKNRTMQLMANSGNSVVRAIAAECCAHVCGKLYQSYDNPNGSGRIQGAGWPDLFPLLLQTMTDTNQSKELRCACSHVFTALGDDAIEFGLDKQHEQVSNAFLKVITKNPDEIECTLQFISDLSGLLALISANDEKYYTRTIPSILDVYAVCLNHQKWDEAEELGKLIVEALQDCPSIFKQHARGVLEGMYKVACSIDTVKAEARLVAVEVLLTFCESDGTVVRKLGYTEKIFLMLLEYCKHPQYESDFETTPPPSGDTDENLEDMDDFGVACTGIDRWAHALRAKHVRDIAAGAIMENVKSSAWQERVAALTAITYIIEACAEQFKKQIGLILNLVYPCLNDESVYVRYAAVTCMSQCCEDFSTKLQKDHHAEILPALCTLLKDCPRNATMAVAAISNFFEYGRDPDLVLDDEEEAMFKYYADNYITPILDAMLNLFENSSHFFVQHEILDCIGIMSESCDKYMAPFVERIVPVCQTALGWQDGFNGYTAEEMNKIRCNALQAVTLLAAGVKYDAFSNYADDVAKVVLELLESGLSYDDPRSQYVLRAWTCLGECMKGHLQPYMQRMMPKLIQIAGRECDVEYIDAPSGMADTDDEFKNAMENLPSGIEIGEINHPERGLVNVKYRTAEAEEKSLALEVLFEMGKELKGTDLYVPFLDDLATVAMDALLFKSLQDVRMAGCNLVSLVFELNKTHKSEAEVAPIVTHLFPRVIALIKDEAAMPVLIQLLDLLRTIVKGGPHNVVDPAHMVDAASVFEAVMVTSVKRKNDLTKAKVDIAQAFGDEDTKLDELQQEDEIEDMTIAACSQVMGMCVKKVPSYMNHFENEVITKIIPAILQPVNSAFEQRAGLYLIYSYLSTGTENGQRILGDAIPTCIQHMANEESIVASSAIFTLAEIVAYVSKIPGYDASELGQAAYGKLIGFWEAHPPGNYDPTEDEEVLFEETRTQSVTLALNLIQYIPSVCDMQQIWGYLGGLLPCKDDEEEAQVIHEKLLRWALGDNKVVANNNAVKNGIINALKNAKKGFCNEITLQELSKL